MQYPNLGNPTTSRNANLNFAKQAQFDEFYTPLEVVQREVIHYKSQFKNKVVYCNCDNPLKSNFVLFFAQNFSEYKLKKLIATHFDKNKAYKLELTKDIRNNGAIDFGDLKKLIKIPLKQNGDFRSEECIELLKQSDIVVTNPPFSLMREYLQTLVEYNKKFLIMAPITSIAYKKIFPLIKENKIRLGVSLHSTCTEFQIPKNILIKTNVSIQDKNGDKYLTMRIIRWITNLKVNNQPDYFIFTQKYYGNENNFPNYDNYNAIEVAKVKNIPMDYSGIMGVPITFLDKFNPEQFEIVGLINGIFLNGKEKFKRILIRNKNPGVNYSAR